MSDWRERAACHGIDDPEIFFPDRNDVAKRAAARAVCDGCSVREQCVEDAISKPDSEGIWGGLSRKQRLKIAKARAEAAGESRARSRHMVQAANERARRIVEMRDSGMDPEDIARELGVCRETVYRAKRRLQEAS